MPTRRVSKKQVTLEADYGHIYSVYGITSDTFKTHTKMLSWVTNTGWFQEDWLRIKNTNNPASKGTKMGAKDTAHHIEAKARQRLRQQKQENFKPFMQKITTAKVEDVSTWCQDVSYSFNPSTERILQWEEDGMSVVGIMESVAARSVTIRNTLQLTVGEWNGLLLIYYRILRGEIAFGGEDNEESEDDEISDADDQDTSIRIFCRIILWWAYILYGLCMFWSTLSHFI
eukprot:263426_1